MTVSSKISLVARCAVTLAAGLALTDCVVTGSAQARPTGSITVQPATVSTSATVQAQPTYQQQTVYAAPQPVYQAQPAPVYQSPTAVAMQQPPPVVGVGVSAGGVVGGAWVTNGYAESDYVSYHMSLRARQFAVGMAPITQLYRAVLNQGGRDFVTVTAAPGRCYRIIGVGGAGVRDLDLRLRDMGGNIIDQDVATDNFPVLGLQRPLCLNYTGTFQIEVIMYSGGGEFGVQAFAQ